MTAAEELATAEAHRLTSWAKDLAYPHQVRAAVAAALVDLVCHACLGQGTDHGPHAFLAIQTADHLRKMYKGDEFYIPVAAPLSLPLPSARHLQSLCEAYGAVRAACEGYTLSVGEVRTLVYGLHEMMRRSSAPWSFTDLEAVGKRPTAVATRICHIMEAEACARGEVYRLGLSYAAREVAKHVAWTEIHHLSRST